VAIVWFSDEDRDRMRREHEEGMAFIERERLFFDFLRERRPNGGIADRDVQVPRRIETLDIRPWPDRHDEN
jgi:hypothetical protein